MDQDQQLLTTKEAAKALAVSEAAIRKWMYQGRLPRVKLGRLTRLRRQDVEEIASGGLQPAR